MSSAAVIFLLSLAVACLLCVIAYNMAEVSFYVEFILKSVVTVIMGFIALYIGMVMHSSKAAAYLLSC